MRWLFAHRASLPHWLRRLLPTPRVPCTDCGYRTRHVHSRLCSDCTVRRVHVDRLSRLRLD